MQASAVRVRGGERERRGRLLTVKIHSLQELRIAPNNIIIIVIIIIIIIIIILEPRIAPARVSVHKRPRARRFPRNAAGRAGRRASREGRGFAAAARLPCYCGVLRAGAPPATSWRTRVLVTQSEATVGAMDGSCSDDSEFEEERAGGGPGADPGRRRLSGVLAEYSLIG